MKKTTKVITIVIIVLFILSTMVLTTFASVNTTYTNQTSVVYSQNGLSEYMIVGRIPSTVFPNNNPFITTHGTLPREYYTTTEPSGQYFYDQSSPTNPEEIGSIVSSPFYINLNTRNICIGQLRLANQFWYTQSGNTIPVDNAHSISLRYKDFIIKPNADLTQNAYRNATELATINVSDEQANYVITYHWEVTSINDGKIDTYTDSYTITLDGSAINGATFDIITFMSDNITDPSSHINYIPEEYISDNGECYVNEFIFTITNEDTNKDSIDDFWLTSTFDRNVNENNIPQFFEENGITETITIIQTIDTDFTEWLSTSVWSFMNIEIFPGLRIYFIIGLMIAIAVVKIFLKMFAGG